MDPTRIDVGMRMVADITSWEQWGRIMDRLHAAFTNALTSEGVEYGALDFTSFQTSPCLEQQMAHYAVVPDNPDLQDARLPLPALNEDSDSLDQAEAMQAMEDAMRVSPQNAASSQDNDDA